MPKVDVTPEQNITEVTLLDIPTTNGSANENKSVSSAQLGGKPPEVTIGTKPSEASSLKFKMPSFKFPKFGIGTEVPTTDKEIKIYEANIKTSATHVNVYVPDVKAELSVPDVESCVLDQQPGAEVDAKLKMPRFSMTKFSFSKSDTKAVDIDVSVPDVNCEILEGKEKERGEGVATQAKEIEIDIDGQEEKFQMTKHGLTIPQTKQPQTDSGLFQKHIDLTLPKAILEAQLLKVEPKESSAEIEVKAPEIKTMLIKPKEESTSRFKMPTFKLPKFGVGTPSVTTPAPKTYVECEGGAIDVPAALVRVNIEAPKTDIEVPSAEIKTTEVDHEDKESKCKIPSLGFSVPEVKKPEIDLSLSQKDVDVTLQETKVEIQLPKVDQKEPSAHVEVRAPEIKVKKKSKEESPSRFKMPTFKLHKLEASATMTAPEKDIKLEKSDIKTPEEMLTVDINAQNTDIEAPSIQMKTTGGEHEGKGLKFKMPSLGFSLPQVKKPEIDPSLTHKDVALSEAKVKVQLPKVELKEPSAEIEVKAPEINIKTKSKEDSPSRFKMPTFKLPKFGASSTMTAPGKDVNLEGGVINVPSEVLSVDIEAPKIGIEGPSIEMKATEDEHEGTGLKFKMPSLGFSLPQVKQPEIDPSLSHKDVALPEANVEVQLPKVELKEPSAEIEVKAPEINIKTKSKEDSPSRFKMPTFKLPKFGASSTMTAPGKDVKLEGGDINVPSEVLSFDIEAPNIAIEGPSIEMKATEDEHEGTGLKFKMPSLGFSLPQVKQPEIDPSLSHKDVALPEANVEVQLPKVELKEPSAEIEVKAPEINIKTKSKEDSPSRFKMPTFKLPKFGARATMTTPEKNIKIEGGDINNLEEVLTVDIEAPTIDSKGPSFEVKAEEVDHDWKGLKLKMPSLGFSVPQVKKPEINLGLSQKDVDVTLPGTNVEVQLPEIELKEPSTEIEVKAPEIKVKTKSKEDSPSRFKIPTFKLPKLAVSAPSVTIAAPEKDVKFEGGDVDFPEKNVTVEIEAPKIDIEGLSTEMKATPIDHDGKGSKLKMPSLGFSVPQVKKPDLNLGLSQKDLDVTQPELNVEVRLPEIELKEPSAEIEVKAPEIKVKTKSKEDSQSRFKMPTLKLPKFAVSAPSVTIAAPEKDVELEGGDDNVPEKDLKVEIEAPKIDIEKASFELKATDIDHDWKGGKLKMPSFGFSLQPEIDLSLSQKILDVTLPEANVEVQLPEMELKEPSAEIEVKAPEIIAKSKSKEDSPSRFKMPTFKLPKFGVSATMTEPEKDVKIEGSDMSLSGGVLTVDNEGPLIELKTAEAQEEEKGNKFEMPGFGFSLPQVKQSDFNVTSSKKNGKDSEVCVNLETRKRNLAATEPKLEVLLADVEVKEASLQTPAAEPDADLKKSKFSLSGFYFSKGSGKETEMTGDLPHVEVSLSKGEVKVKNPEMEPKQEADGQQIKFKLPTLGASPTTYGIVLSEVKGLPEDDLSASKKNVAIHVAHTGECKLNENASASLRSVDNKTDESKMTLLDAETANPDTNSLDLGSPSKFKLPSFKMPKLSFSRPKPQDEFIPVDFESKEELKIEIQLDRESKTPNVTLVHHVLNNSGLEFDGPVQGKRDYLESNTDEALTEQKEVKVKELTTKQDITKSPERTGWFKFPKFGLSSPSSPAKTPETDEKKCPMEKMVDEEISPTSSVQSSDAFADISSAMTSETVGLSLSSPTKVTVKYSDCNTVPGSENIDSNVIMSTTRTEQISVEPSLPEKINILSSGVSSSSEDTLRLESRKTHVITSNIEMTPETQHAMLLKAVEFSGPHVKPEKDEVASWIVKGSQGGKRTIFERQLVKKTLNERSESKETVVITKQITRTSMFESSEPISGETATAVQQLRQSVHSEKMRFFDKAEK